MDGMDAQTEKQSSDASLGTHQIHKVDLFAAAAAQSVKCDDSKIGVSACPTDLEGARTPPASRRKLITLLALAVIIGLFIGGSIAFVKWNTAHSSSTNIAIDSPSPSPSVMFPSWTLVSAPIPPAFPTSLSIETLSIPTSTIVIPTLTPVVTSIETTVVTVTPLAATA